MFPSVKKQLNNNHLFTFIWDPLLPQTRFSSAAEFASSSLLRHLFGSRHDFLMSAGHYEGRVGGRSECFPSSVLKSFSSSPFVISPLCYFLPRSLLHLPLLFRHCWPLLTFPDCTCFRSSSVTHKARQVKTLGNESSWQHIYIKCWAGNITWFIYKLTAPICGSSRVNV